MARLPYARLFGGVVLAVSLAGLARVYGDDVPCYQAITAIPCPTCVTNDTCQAQFDNQSAEDKKTPGPTCGKLVYNARKSGQYGQDGKTPCLTPGPETGYKCVPELDTNGKVLREACCHQYKCWWAGLPNGCVQGDLNKTFYADKYKLDDTGCLPVKKEEEN
jgi:hypothetical protein